MKIQFIPCKFCGVRFRLDWSKRRKYCSIGCYRSMRKQKNNERAKARRWELSRKCKARKASKGRQCRWAHCRVDDVNHSQYWNGPNDICSACYRQSQRVPACRRCSGPKYQHRRTGRYYCPTCEPRVPCRGEVSVTLVCNATGRERDVIRNRNWITPDGLKLSSIEDGGFAVIDLAPEVWAHYKT